MLFSEMKVTSAAVPVMLMCREWSFLKQRNPPVQRPGFTLYLWNITSALSHICPRLHFTEWPLTCVWYSNISAGCHLEPRALCVTYVFASAVQLDATCASVRIQAVFVCTQSPHRYHPHKTWKRNSCKIKWAPHYFSICQATHVKY